MILSYSKTNKSKTNKTKTLNNFLGFCVVKFSTFWDSPKWDVCFIRFSAIWYSGKKYSAKCGFCLAGFSELGISSNSKIRRWETPPFAFRARKNSKPSRYAKNEVKRNKLLKPAILLILAYTIVVLKKKTVSLFLTSQIFSNSQGEFSALCRPNQHTSSYFYRLF